MSIWTPGPKGLVGLGRPAALRPYVSGSEPAYLLEDNFDGAVAALAGRVPKRGEAWTVSGASGTQLVAGGGEMFQSAGGPAAYAMAALARTPREVGCKFRLQDVYVGLTLGGTFTAGSQLAVQVRPSRSAAPTVVLYTAKAGDANLTGVATSLAASIMADPAMTAAGITAAASGTTVRLRAAESPRIEALAVVSGTVLMASDASDSPTLACFHAGEDFLNGMLHWRIDPSGYLDWSIYVNDRTALAVELGRATRGLKANVEYTYRCRLDGDATSGEIVDASGEVVSSLAAADPRAATLSGSGVFFETGAPNLLRYSRAWAV